MTRDGYGQAYQRGFDLTVRFLLSRGVRREQAREVAQAAWVRGWERLSQLRDETLVVTWVNAIALNVHRGGMRREPLNLNTLEVRDRTVAIDVAAIDMKKILGSCRPQDRALLERCLVGASMAEIAQGYGVSETAIRIRVLRARRHARGRVEQRPSRRRRNNLLLLAQSSAA